MVGESGKVHGKRMGKTSDIEYQGAGQKPCRAPTEPYKRPCHSKARRQPEEKAIVLMEDRRWRSAFENLANEMLRYLDNSDDVKLGVTELQERLEVPVQIGISI